MYCVLSFAAKLPLITTSFAGIVKSFLSQPLNVYPGAVASSATVTLAPYLYVFSVGNALAPVGTFPSYSYVTL